MNLYMKVRMEAHDQASVHHEVTKARQERDQMAREVERLKVSHFTSSCLRLSIRFCIIHCTSTVSIKPQS